MFEQVSAQPNTIESPNNLLTFTDYISKIKINYPSDWIKVEGNLLNVTDESKFNLLINDISFVPTDDSVIFTITANRVPNDISSSEFADANIISIKSIPTLQIISINKTTVDDIPAYEVEVEGNLDFEGMVERFGQENKFGYIDEFGGFQSFNAAIIKQSTIFVAKDGIGYVIQYMSQPLAPNGLEQYGLYLPIIQQMIDSIEFLQ